MRKIIAGNWKMNNGPHEASVLVHHLTSKVKPHPEVTVVLCVPYIDLFPLAREIDRDKFLLGAQNAHHLDEGPYTGEISAAMLRGLAEYCIVGHSERRQHAHEDDKLVAEKIRALLRHGIRPIVCVGDRLIDREHNLAARVVVDQLTAALVHVSADELSEIVLAYEPVWAISQGDGRGTYAKPDEVAPVVKAIRDTLEELFGEGSADRVPLLYGGSANPDNAKAYLKMSGIDGLLTGGASLHYEQFSQMITAAQEVAGN
jgi:triosephosphate isomerase (TIM)